MDRGTKTEAKELKPGDRFYKVGDAKKRVMEMVEYDKKKTAYQTYKYWYVYDGLDKRYPRAINGATEVVFLRHRV